MRPYFLRGLAAAFGIAILFAATDLALAQNNEVKPEKPAGEAKDPQKKIDEFAEAEQSLVGPAANRECVWLGRRVVSLLWRDDLDTAFRHLDLYDRFGCPADHIQATFRCVLSHGEIDPKAAEKLNARVHACWVNPTGEMKGTASAPSTSTNR
ncbi:MAG: beta-1-3, beta-1-6-glucan biosynthesis protein [Xanthobacteraceae bacterium]